MPAKVDSNKWVVLGCVVLALVALTVLVAGQIAVAQGPIILDGVAGAGEWDPSWQVATDPLDVFITGSNPPAHPHDPSYYARSGYDATGVWARYQAINDRWYFRVDVDGRPADSDSAWGAGPGALGVATHMVDQGPLQGDSTGVGPPEAYRLRFRFEPGNVSANAELAGNSAILPGVLSPTTLGLTGQAVYSTTYNPGVLEWEFARDEVIPVGTAYREMWLWAQMGDNSDIVSDDNVQEGLVLALDLVAGCPAAPAVAGSEATFPLDYRIPATATLGATNVVLTAGVPSGTAFVSASNGGAESGGVITWNLGNLAPGASGQVTFVLSLDPDPALTSLTIPSAMSCDEGLRYQGSHDCPVQQPPPVLELDVNCPAAPIVVGQQATFPLDYAVPATSINGATGVVLTADVPPGTTFVSASDGGTESGGVITWNLPHLSPGDSGQVTFTLNVGSDPTLTSLTINSEITCREQVTEQASNTCPVGQPPLPVLELNVNCPAAPIVVGQEATFPLDYAVPATSVSGATNVVLTADVPPGTTFVSAGDGGTESGGVITWNLADLSPGESGQVTFILSIDPDFALTSLTIDSEMTCDEGATEQSSNTCPVGQQPPPSAPPPVVPEAATVTLMLSAMGGMAGYATLQWRARRRK